jgi:protein-S-isoprenylcysteine O-methyltransferase Ste14
MNETITAVIWAIGMIGVYIIRHPHQKRAKKQAVDNHQRSTGERTVLAIATIGLIGVPALQLAFKLFSFADYSFRPVLAWIGIIVLAAFLALFHKSHRQLGKNWSITLEIREEHKLVTDGLYRYVRHPMYSAFWLWAIAQSFIFPNWIAGFSGLVGVGILYFSRVGKEETMMRQTFGKVYEEYCAKTGRIFPKFKRQ